MSKSWKGEVFVQGEWVSNGLRFATQEEAFGYAEDLFRRWTLCEDSQAVPSDDDVTKTWSSDGAVGDVKTGESHIPPDRVSL